jgi:hypothetical protein
LWSGPRLAFTAPPGAACCLWSRRSSGESAEIKATFQRALCQASQRRSVGAPQTRLWSEICDPLDRHRAGAVKADTFPRYFTKALQIAGFS